MVSWNPNCCSRSVDQYPVHTTTRSAVMVSGPTTLQLLPDLASDVTNQCSRIRTPRDRAALAGAATPSVEVTLPSLGVYVAPRIPSVPSHGLSSWICLSSSTWTSGRPICFCSAAASVSLATMSACPLSKRYPFSYHDTGESKTRSAVRQNSSGRVWRAAPLKTSDAQVIGGNHPQHAPWTPTSTHPRSSPSSTFPPPATCLAQ